MLSRRFASSQIPLRRPRRPPTSSDLHPLPQPRRFTQNSQLLLVARHTPRPQLPYLSQPSFARRPSPLDQNILRLLSTETRTYVKDQAWLAARWTVIGWTFLILSGIIYFGVQIESDERRNPTPDEWSFWTRNYLRGARADKEDRSGYGRVDWARAGDVLLRALERLETGVDAKGVVEPEGGEGILIPDLGKAGFDISAKSWPWRAGYYEVLMLCAEAAEHLEDMVLDTTRHLVYPKEVIVGPSNPDPRPVAAYMGAAPLKENTTRAYDSPESFYMRILTSSGFTTKQRLDAAWKYANWLEYRGLNESAEEMYLWAVDIATSALPEPDNVIDVKSAVLKGSSPASTARARLGPTANLLSATTALAIHRARTGDVASALPILLSVLRARREAPVLPPTPSSTAAQASSDGGSDLDAVVSLITRVLSPPRFPPPPPSGDDTFTRPNAQPGCEESELMLYVGEILFATSPSPSQGLDWTRQAVTIAEANIDAATATNKKVMALSQEQQRKCKSCLRTGVANWETMLEQLSSSSSRSAAREGGRNAGFLEWCGWFGGGGGEKGKTHEELRAGVSAEEMKQIERLKEKVAREAISEDMYKSRGAPGGVWIG